MSSVLNLTVLSSVKSIPVRSRISSRNASFAVAKPAWNTFQWPTAASTRFYKRNGQLHTATRCSASSQNSTSSLSERETGNCDSDRPPFDLNLAVLLAGFAFEVYNSPKVSIHVSYTLPVDGLSCKNWGDRRRKSERCLHPTRTAPSSVIARLFCKKGNSHKRCRCYQTMHVDTLNSPKRGIPAGILNRRCFEL